MDAVTDRFNLEQWLVGNHGFQREGGEGRVEREADQYSSTFVYPPTFPPHSNVPQWTGVQVVVSVPHDAFATTYDTYEGPRSVLVWLTAEGSFIPTRRAITLEGAHNAVQAALVDLDRVLEGL